MEIKYLCSPSIYLFCWKLMLDCYSNPQQKIVQKKQVSWITVAALNMLGQSFHSQKSACNESAPLIQLCLTPLIFLEAYSIS